MLAQDVALLNETTCFDGGERLSCVVLPGASSNTQGLALSLTKVTPIHPAVVVNVHPIVQTCAIAPLANSEMHSDMRITSNQIELSKRVVRSLTERT